YEKKIYNLAFRITGNKDDASDILQDTFLQIYKKLGTFREESSFSTWIYRIAVNSALMKKRKDKRTSAVSLDKPLITDKGEELKRQLKDDWSSEPIDIIENNELKEALDVAVNSLEPKYRLPLVLRDIQGLSNKEVAGILNISLTAVKSRVHRARFFLRNELSRYFSGSGGGRIMDFIKFCRLLSDYCDSELSFDICSEIEEFMHEECICKTMFNTFQRTIELCNELEEMEVPQQIHIELHRTLHIIIETEDDETF
ncbi:RNA polymerase sigma factor, partial [Elusimicrobiota bacterium]